MTPIYFIFLFFCLSLGLKTCTYKGYDKFDYLVLTQTWPSTLCQNLTCQENNVHPYFIIEDFKPALFNQSDFSGPECCKSKTRFSLYHLSHIFDLGLYWTDLSGESNYILREKWKRYGSCMVKGIPKFSFEKYFTTTLKLYKKTKVLKTFLENKIFPNNKLIVNHTKIEEIFKKVSLFSFHFLEI